MFRHEQRIWITRLHNTPGIEGMINAHTHTQTRVLVWKPLGRFPAACAQQLSASTCSLGAGSQQI
eukprot:1157416-Pelagomonas_calceolata.AAC.7